MIHLTAAPRNIGFIGFQLSSLLFKGKTNATQPKYFLKIAVQLEMDRKLQ